MTQHFKKQNRQTQRQTIKIDNNRNNNGQFNHYRFRRELD